MENKKWNEGYVYLIDYGDGEQFKIGMTVHDPEKRLNQIIRGTGLIYPSRIECKLVLSVYVQTNVYYTEQLIHMTMANKHIAGEWFNLSDFRDLSRVAGIMDVLGGVRYYDRWFEIVPKDYLGYVSNYSAPSTIFYTRTAEACGE
jgi:hypothetical protein